MSPTIDHHRVQAPPSDFLTRHEYGITKKRKHSSTGGGRAWSEQEEAYLLQTRLQKMPYKHIAAHLKKTELACRLHYHQICHGPNKKRHLSVSSTSSSLNSSPILPSQMDHREVIGYGAPPVQQGMYQQQLYARTPSMSPPNTYLPVHSQQHIPILPKPTQALPPPRTLLPSQQQPLRLNTTQSPSHSTPPMSSEIDMAKLRYIYNSHLSTFWSNIAKDYGNVSPLVLEAKWRQVHGVSTPLTPRGSPDPGYGSQGEVGGEVGDKGGRLGIRMLLGVDASPRSREEREVVRRLEEGGG